MVDLLCALLSCSEVVLAEFSYLHYSGASFSAASGWNCFRFKHFHWKVCKWTVGRAEGQCEGFNEEL